MADTARTVIAFSEKQNVNRKYFVSPNEIENWLDSYCKPHTTDGISYYLHIDQLQILPPDKNGNYQVFIIFHRVYLRVGE